MSQKQKNFYDWILNNSSWIAIVAISISIGALFLPITVAKLSTWGFDFSQMGNFGDMMGGITGPFIAIGVGILTLLVFVSQHKAFLDQRKDIQLERFQSNFFELLRLHRENVNDIKLSNGVHGREAFVHLLAELLAYYRKAEAISIGSSINIEKENLLKFSYTLFFYGLEMKEYFEDGLLDDKKKIYEDLTISLLKRLKETREKHNNHEYDEFYQHIVDQKSGRKIENNEMENDEYVVLYHKPFNGYISLLGHYFRHLYFTAKFIDSYPDLDPDIKKQSFKILRAQLSDQEQLLLHYNSVAFFPKEWEPFFVDYKLIKNLPAPLAVLGPPLEEYYKTQIEELKKKGEKMFDWV